MPPVGYKAWHMFQYWDIILALSLSGHLDLWDGLPMDHSVSQRQLLLLRTRVRFSPYLQRI